MRAGHRPATAAALTLLVAFASGCADDAPVATPTTSEPTRSVRSSAPTSTPTSTPTGTPTAAAPADEAGAIAVVDAWLGTIGSGDPEQVRAGLGPVSRAALEAMGGIDSIMSGLTEGMASFGQSGLRRAAVAVPGHEGAWLVTYSGEVSSEGMTAYDAHSWLVVPGEGGARVETFASPPPQVLAPVDRTAAGADEAVTVTLPAGGEALAVLDGSTVLPDPLVEGVDGDQVQVSAAPQDGLPSGNHVVTVAVVPGSGATAPWATTAVAFTAG